MHRAVNRTESLLANTTRPVITRAGANQWRKTIDARGCVTENKIEISKKITNTVRLT